MAATVVEVDRDLQGSARDVAATNEALSCLAEILSESLDLPGMLGGLGRSRRDR